MVTIKLKKPSAAPSGVPAARRAPVRGTGTVARPRPTLAEAQAEREAARRAMATPAAPAAPPVAAKRARPVGERRPPPRPEALPRRDAPRRSEAPRPDAQRRPEAPRRPDVQRADAPRRPDVPFQDAPRRPDAQRPDPRRADARRAEPQRFDAPRRDAPRADPPRRDAAPVDPRRRAPSKASAPPRRAAPQTADTGPAKRRPFDRPANPGPGAAEGPGRDLDDDDDDFPAAPPEHAPGSVRLSKRMSELGIASRREADEWIAKGWVRVDDQIVAELGSRVLPGQRVTVDAKAKYQQAQKVTVLVHKPVGYVSGQAEDGYEPAVVLVTPENQWRDDRSGTRFLREHLKSLVPAGRLDIDSVGLLVLTQDGRVAKQLIGEETEVEKEYLVRVATAAGGSSGLSDEGLALLRHGLELDGEPLRPATVEWLNADQLRFVLGQGKKRQIRRMCEAVGLQVLGLKRVRIGQIVLGDLPPGQWRYLRRDEAFA